jgi:hypothetical protein
MQTRPLPIVRMRAAAAWPRRRRSAHCLLRRPPTPIAARDIDLVGDCRRTEEDGFREDAQLRVSNNTVQQFQWKLWVGKRGSCSFNLADFRQVKKTPHIELRANDGSACKLMVWQDPRRVTLAHANCQAHCTPGIYAEHGR